MEFKTILLDGVSIQVADDSVKAVETLAKQVKDTMAKVEAKDGEIAALRASHTTALETKDGEIAALKAKVPDAAALDKLITARSGLIDSARKVLGDSFDASGKSDAEIRRAAVAHKLGDKAVGGKSDDYIGAAFDTLAAMSAPAGRDPVRYALRTHVPTRDARTDSYAEMVAGLKDAWKTPSNEKEAA
jgi:hypothetical protein